MRLALLLAASLLLVVPVVEAGPVWRDCNGDGYVGFTILQVNPYPAFLLNDFHVCPPGSPWNDGEWVTEF